MGFTTLKMAALVSNAERKNDGHCDRKGGFSAALAQRIADVVQKVLDERHGVALAISLPGLFHST